MLKKLNLMCVFTALILMWTTHGLALDYSDSPVMEEVNACFNNGGSPDQCCGMIGDAERRDMCMNDSGEVDACFNSGGSSDPCCAMIDDEHGRNMCLKHSQDGMRHDDRDVRGGGFVLKCDPDMDYPQATPGANGCKDYLDCNDNGAYDLEEPCTEHD